MTRLSTRHSQARAAQQLFDLVAGHQAEIARDAELERGRRRREADGVVPVAILEAAHDHFTDLSITGSIGNRTLSFSATGLTGVTSNAVNITPGAVSQLGHTVTAVIATGGGTLNGAINVVTNASGVATFTGLSITGTIGDRTLSFDVPSLTGATSSTITLTPGAATRLTITTQPSAAATSGVAFAQQPAIQLRDAAGNAVSQLGTVVTAAIATGGGRLGGTLTASSNASGVATFFNLSITGPPGSRTLNFSATGLAGATSTTITIP